MLVALVALICLASVALARGRLAALADVRLRGAWLVASALLAQVLVISIFPGSLAGTHRPVHLATYALVAAFLWSNRRIPGIWLVAMGAAANVIVISANAGVMPASAAALATAGMPAGKGSEFANSATLPDARLPWLGDVFAVPASWPVSNVFSVGDLLIAAGFALGVHVLCGSVLGRAWTGAGRRLRRAAAPTALPGAAGD
jgi:hypothetical protein